MRMARCGKPPWSLTRLRRSSPQAKTTRPYSTNEAVASLSSGLIPRTRMVHFLKMSGHFGDRRGFEFGPIGTRAEDLIHVGEEAVLVGLGGDEAVLAGHERGAMDCQADAGKVHAPQALQEWQH